ncbi:hypothetical protein CIB84_014291, partial [Bambusicola thoracicus]
ALLVNQQIGILSMSLREMLECAVLSEAHSHRVCKREERAGERAHPDTKWERVPTGDKGRVELGEATKEILAQGNKNLSNSSSPFHSAI